MSTNAMVNNTISSFFLKQGEARAAKAAKAAIPPPPNTPLPTAIRAVETAKAAAQANAVAKKLQQKVNEYNNELQKKPANYFLQQGRTKAKVAANAAKAVANEAAEEAAEAANAAETLAPLGTPPLLSKTQANVGLSSKTQTNVALLARAQANAVFSAKPPAAIPEVRSEIAKAQADAAKAAAEVDVAEKAAKIAIAKVKTRTKAAAESGIAEKAAIAKAKIAKPRTKARSSSIKANINNSKSSQNIERNITRKQNELDGQIRSNMQKIGIRAELEDLQKQYQDAIMIEAEKADAEVIRAEEAAANAAVRVAAAAKAAADAAAEAVVRVVAYEDAKAKEPPVTNGRSPMQQSLDRKQFDEKISIAARAAAAARVAVVEANKALTDAKFSANEAVKAAVKAETNAVKVAVKAAAIKVTSNENEVSAAAAQMAENNPLFNGKNIPQRSPVKAVSAVPSQDSKSQMLMQEWLKKNFNANESKIIRVTKDPTGIFHTDIVMRGLDMQKDVIRHGESRLFHVELEGNTYHIRLINVSNELMNVSNNSTSKLTDKSDINHVIESLKRIATLINRIPKRNKTGILEETNVANAQSILTSIKAELDIALPFAVTIKNARKNSDNTHNINKVMKDIAKFTALTDALEKLIQQSELAALEPKK